jgi:stage III sporulation protein AD
MSIIAISFIGLLSSLVALSLRRKNSEISYLVALCGSVIILLAAVLNINSIVGTVKSVLAVASVNSVYISIMLKAVAICFLTEFACDSCVDAGQRALAGNIALAGKLLVLVNILPLYKELLDVVTSLNGGGA